MQQTSTGKGAGASAADATAAESPLLDERALSKLHWRCRRGLLENDLFIAQFFERYESSLTERHAAGLLELMDLADNDLLDILLRRREPEGALNTPNVQDVLAMLRPEIGIATPPCCLNKKHPSRRRREPPQGKSNEVS